MQTNILLLCQNIIVSWTGKRDTKKNNQVIQKQ